jgi:hypothetical protein
MAKSKKRVAAKPEYEPTAAEISAVRKFAAQQKAVPRLRVTKGTKGTNASRLEPDHPEPAVGYALLGEALGTADFDFLSGLLSQLANASASGREGNEEELGFMLSLVKGVKPKDEVEAMLAAQMAAVHLAMMSFARRLNHVETIQQQDSAERAFNKLARTFATQMEALKRYRTGGEQKVTVQHVSVSEGGQAIVGNVTQAPRESAPEKPAPAALTHSPGTTMPMAAKSGKRERARRPPKE